MPNRLVDLARDIKVVVGFIKAVNPDNIEIYPPSKAYEFLEDRREELEAAGLLIRPTRVALKLLSEYRIPIAFSPNLNLEDQDTVLALLGLLKARDEAEFGEMLRRYADALETWASREMDHVGKEKLREAYEKIGKLIKSGTVWEFWDHVWQGGRYEGTASISLGYEVYDVRSKGIPRFGVFVRIRVYYPPPYYVSDELTVDYALCDTLEEAQESLRGKLTEWKESLKARIRNVKDILEYYEGVAEGF